MKRQIRQGVFETNSSSVHSLSISTDYIDVEKYKGTTLEFRYIDGITDEKSLAWKINQLYIWLVEDRTFREFIENREILIKAFKQYGIDIDFRFPTLEEYDHIWWNGSTLVFDELFKEDNDLDVLGIHLMEYLFNEESCIRTYNNNYFDMNMLPDHNFINYIEYELTSC